jgi:hypothetical protein
MRPCPPRCAAGSRRCTPSPSASPWGQLDGVAPAKERRRGWPRRSLWQEEGAPLQVLLGAPRPGTAPQVGGELSSAATVATARAWKGA